MLGRQDEVLATACDVYNIDRVLKGQGSNVLF